MFLIAAPLYFVSCEISLEWSDPRLNEKRSVVNVPPPPPYKLEIWLAESGSAVSGQH